MLFLVNKNAQIKTGDHKVHTFSCSRKPDSKNTIELGDFYDVRVAQCEAKKYFFNVDGCNFCCKPIHLKK